jgi:hypothetical protein
MVGSVGIGVMGLAVGIGGADIGMGPLSGAALLLLLVSISPVTAVLRIAGTTPMIWSSAPRRAS